MGITVRCPAKLVPLLTKPKRMKIALGGRGGAKSITFADAFLKSVSGGEKVLCAREFQNSIEDSVHSLLKARIEALEAPGFNVLASTILHSSGGAVIYKGLARNTESIKSLFGVKKAWIEEGQSLSEESIDKLLPTIREGDSEIWVSMNRGSSKDPIAKQLLNHYEPVIEKQGFYEDEDLLIVEINYYDNPFFPEVLERQRLKDYERLSRAKYDHIWEGKYSDQVENAIIEPEWFDACVDAHLKLGFKPEGREIVAHDPADGGHDPKAFAYRHGSVIVDCQQRTIGDVNEGCDWATGFANEKKADAFIWDADGMGAGLKRQVNEAFKGKKITAQMFNGGAAVDMPDAVYDPLPAQLLGPGESAVQKPKTNRETFFNRRAQRYGQLRDRCFRTWLAVKKGKYIDPGELISFSSAIKDLRTLRSELCRIPKKDRGDGKLQILNKAEMKSVLKLSSPNMGDCVMMTEERIVGSSTIAKNYDIPAAYSPFQ